MSISEALRRFRKEFDLNQKTVADALEMMPQAYYKYESGKVVPSANVILKLSQSFNVSADYLLGLSDLPRPPDVATLVSAINNAQEILGNALERRAE